jgi:RNA polymerase sigma-70 factor, ECF subfamily
VENKELLADPAIVEKIISGDKEAFALLVERYQKGLINFIYHMVGHYEEALELTQDVFIKVYSNLESYDCAYKFSTWLYRIASNCTIDHLRRRDPAADSLDDRDEDECPKIEIESDDPLPHDILEKKFLEREIVRSVMELQPDYRELIVLRHIHFRSYEEIAKITNLPIGTVKNRIFRARKQLVDSLKDKR